VLKLLLDEHVSREVAAALRRWGRSLEVYCMAEWEQGSYLGLDDSACLEKAGARGLTLVTYDRRTIPPLLKAWAQEDRNHGGVIFVDDKTIPPHDIGGLVRALFNLFEEAGRWDWTNRVCFLRR
jgi:hypothetical protein